MMDIRRIKPASSGMRRRSRLPTSPLRFRKSPRRNRRAAGAASGHDPGADCRRRSPSRVAANGRAHAGRDSGADARRRHARPSASEPEVRRAEPVHPEDLAKAQAGTRGVRALLRQRNRFDIRPLRKTFVGVNARYRDRSVLPSSAGSMSARPVQLRGKQIAVKVLDPADVEIRKNGKIVARWRYRRAAGVDRGANQSAAAAPPQVGMISLGCAKNLVDAEIMLGSVLQHGMQITADADDADVLVVNTCAFIDSAKEESIDAILGRASAARAREKARAKIDRERLHVAAICQGTARATAGSGCLHRARSGEGTRRDHRARCRTRALIRQQFGHAAADLHSELRYPALSSDAVAQRVFENCRRLQSSVQLLRHPADARPASQPAAGLRALRNSLVSRGRREGDQSDQPGHDLLRDGFVGGESRAASAGGFVAGRDALRVAARDSESPGRILGAPALHASRRIGATN